MEKLIEGVCLTDLKIVEDERGMLLHMMRSESEVFSKFGEIYFSLTNPGIIKGWKKHFEMTQNFAVPAGIVKIVLFDDREGSHTFGRINEFTLSLDHYKLLTIPPKVWYSFKALSEIPGMIANCTDLSHNPDETITTNIDSSKIPYKWV